MSHDNEIQPLFLLRLSCCPFRLHSGRVPVLICLRLALWCGGLAGLFVWNYPSMKTICIAMVVKLVGQGFWISNCDGACKNDKEKKGYIEKKKGKKGDHPDQTEIEIHVCRLSLRSIQERHGKNDIINWGWEKNGWNKYCSLFDLKHHPAGCKLKTKFCFKFNSNSISLYSYRVCDIF